MFAWEAKSEPLASRGVLAGRLAGSLGVALALIAASLLAGMAGYRYLEGLSWVDAFENAAMILSGMGPVAGMKSEAGKIFAGAYAIYSGLLLIAATGLILAPVLHRVMHSLHVEDDD